jgi:hypothetical protein
MNTKTPPVAAFGFFNVHAPVPTDIRGENLDGVIEKMRKSTDEFNRALGNVPSHEESFGKRLKEAVKRKTGARAASATAPRAEEETFAERLKRVTQEKSGAKQHKEQAERERARYRNKPRQRTKGE